MNKKVITYLGILWVICPVFYFLSIRAGGLQGGSVFVMGLMWVPALAAICTKLIYDHSLKGIGWKIKGWKQMGFAYILPLLSCTASLYMDVHGSPDWAAALLWKSDSFSLWQP